MGSNVMEGIISFARKEIETRIRAQSEKIVAEVIMDTMKRLSVQQIDREGRLTTELIFMFEREME